MKPLSKYLGILLIFISLSSYTIPLFPKNEDYTLSIEKGKVRIDHKKNIYEIPVTLTNNTDDTLKYYSMLCSWTDFYKVSNQKLYKFSVLCDKNFPVILKLAPHEKQTVALNLLLKNPEDKSPLNFRIGFELRKAYKKDEFGFPQMTDEKELIWSNEITL